MKIAKSLIIAVFLGTLTADALQLQKHHKKHHQHHHEVPAEYVQAYGEDEDAASAAAKVANSADKSDAVPEDARSLENLAAKKEAAALKEEQEAEEAKAVPIGNLMEKLERKEKIKALQSVVDAPPPALSEDEQKEQDKKEVTAFIEQADVNKHAKAVAKLQRKIAKDTENDDPSLREDLKKAQALVDKDTATASTRAADEKAEPKPTPEKDAARAQLAILEARQAKDDAVKAAIMRASDQSSDNGPSGQKAVPNNADVNKEAQAQAAVQQKIAADAAAEAAAQNEKDAEQAAKDAKNPKRNDGAEDAEQAFDEAKEKQIEAQEKRDAAARVAEQAIKDAANLERKKRQADASFKECSKDGECWTANMPQAFFMSQQRAENMVEESDSDSDDE